MTELSTVAALVEPQVDVRGVATHPEDDIVLSTALSGRATILCTRDKQLLRLRAYADIRILSPGEFMTLLKSQVVP